MHRMVRLNVRIADDEAVKHLLVLLRERILLSSSSMCSPNRKYESSGGSDGTCTKR